MRMLVLGRMLKMEGRCGWYVPSEAELEGWAPLLVVVAPIEEQRAVQAKSEGELEQWRGVRAS